MSAAMNNPLVKTLKTVNFMAGKASSLAEIKRHRKQSEWAHGLATPLGEAERKEFRVGKIRCEEIRPANPKDTDHVILYCHGGGYICGGLGYAGNLGVKLAAATGFTVYTFAYRLVPSIIFFFVSAKMPLAWVICLMVSVILFAGAVIFRGRAVAAEFRRRLHL